MAFLLRKNVSVAGHRVLYVNEKGPGGLAGLVPFLDVVTAVDGEALDDTAKSLAAMMSQRVEKRVELTVYNLKTRALRKTFIVRGAPQSQSQSRPHVRG